MLDALVQLGRERGDLDDLPESLEELIAAEIDVLAPLPRAVLRYASVLGRSFHPWWAKNWSPTSACRSTTQCSTTCAASSTSPPTRSGSGRRWCATSPTRACRTAADVSSTSEPAKSSSGPPPAPSTRRPGCCRSTSTKRVEYERAWRYARIAGTAAEAAFANVEAAALYRRALDAARRLPGVSATEQVETWISLGDVLERSGRFDDALSAYRRATPLTGDDVVARARTLLKRARVRERAGAFVAAQRELRSAERAVADDRSDDADRVRTAAATLRAIVHEGREQPRRALRVAEKAAADAERLGELHDVARAYSVMDWAYVSLGTPELAVHQPRAIEIYESLGLPHRAATALGNLGALHFWAGRWTEAEECYRRAHEALVRTGDVVNCRTRSKPTSPSSWSAGASTARRGIW